MKKGILALAFLPFLLVGDERVILSPADRGELANVHVAPLDHAGVGVEYHPPFATGGGSSLLANLVAYWNLDELSGTRAKTAGSCTSCDLTAVNSPSWAGGAGNYALSVVAASSQGLTVADSADMSVTGEFGACAWFRTSTVAAGTAVILAKDAPAGNREYSLYRSAATVVALVGDGTAAAPVTIATGNVLTAGVPAFACMWWDSADSKVYVSANGAAASASIATVTPGDAANAFTVGNDGTSYFDGVIGPVYFYEGGATPGTIVTSLYNSSIPKSCGSLTVAEQVLLTHCWDLTEASGARADSVGSVDLSAVNAPGRSAGLVDSGLGMSYHNSSTGSLQLTSNADVQAGDVSFSWCAWINQRTANNTGLVDKGNQGEYTLDINGANLRFYIKNGGSYPIATTAVPSLNAWHLVCGWKDAEENKLYVQADEGAAGSANETGVPATDAGNLRVGLLASNFLGGLDALGFWKRVLTSLERTALYNAGAGVEYPWSSIASLFQRPPSLWALRSVEEKQRVLYARHGVVVPAFMIPSRRVFVR